MERKVIKSGAISEVGWENGTLEVLFPSGALWRYYDVPETDYESFMRAESAGHFFAVAIRACYKSSRVHIDGNTHETKCGDQACFCAKLTKTSREENRNAPSETKNVQKRKTAQKKLRSGI